MNLGYTFQEIQVETLQDHGLLKMIQKIIDLNHDEQHIQEYLN